MKRVLITLTDNVHYEIKVKEDVAKNLEDIEYNLRFLLIKDAEGNRHLINLDHLMVIVIREVENG